MSVDHASAVAAPKSDPVFLHVRPGMTVIVTDTEGAWRMADVIWVDGGARNPKAPTLSQVADVDTGVINWVNADLRRSHGLAGSRNSAPRPRFIASTGLNAELHEAVGRSLQC